MSVGSPNTSKLNFMTGIMVSKGFLESMVGGGKQVLYRLKIVWVETLKKGIRLMTMIRLMIK